EALLGEGLVKDGECNSLEHAEGRVQTLPLQPPETRMIQPCPGANSQSAAPASPHGARSLAICHNGWHLYALRQHGIVIVSAPVPLAPLDKSEWLAAVHARLERGLDTVAQRRERVSGLECQSKPAC